MSCAWGNYQKCRLSGRDCLPLMWPASLWGLLWQLVDGVTENKWGVFSRSWYGEEGANWVHRKGAFPKQWEDCALLSEVEQIYNKICAHFADTSAAAPVRQPCLHRSAPPGLAVSLGYLRAACSAAGLGLQPDACAESRRGPWSSARSPRSHRGNCAPVLHWMLHCNKSKLTAGTGWNAPMLQTPPSPKSSTVHQGSLYKLTLSFLVPLTRWDGGRWIVKRVEAFLFFFIFFFFFHFSCFCCRCLGLSPAD